MSDTEKLIGKYEQDLKSIELQKRRILAELRSISLDAPICRGCKGTHLHDWGSTYKCQECGLYTSKVGIKTKRIPR